jgi:F-type H+-transporting ATPase subunit delta
VGSATKEALGVARVALSALGKADLATGEQILAAGRVIGDSTQLLSALGDPSAEPADRASIVNAVFASLAPDAKKLLTVVATSRWSDHDDLLGGIEELGIRVLARSAGEGAAIENELFVFAKAVLSNSELELAVSSKLGTAEQKADLINRLVGGKVSAQTLAILSQLVQQPRGRRIAELIRHATSIVADEAGLEVATVTTAAPIEPAQLTRLATALAGAHGRNLRINHVIDPEVIGGVRVKIGDEVIDGSLATRMNDLRLTLAS